jgi:peptidoglycan/LPS O-acetylase OafA/YrhL
MGYRREIDGLRALAVTAVVVYHFFPQALKHGYLGVDIFFVISGYLITQQLLLQSFSLISLRTFYARRIRRLFPALYVFLTICTAVVSHIWVVADLSKYQDSLLAASTFWANWYFWRDGGYFGPSDQLKPLLHIWSLAVEEQFYILYPAALILAVTYARKRLVFLIAVAAIVSFSLWAYLNHIGGHRPAFFLLPTRAWELLAGAFVAALHSSKKVDHFSSLSWVGVALIVMGLSSRFSPDVSTILSVLGSAFFIFARIWNQGIYTKFFTNHISVYIGKLSYSWYLYHWPIAVLLLYVSVDGPSIPISACGILVSLTLAMASYHCVEKPFRYNYSTQKGVLLVVLLATVSFVYVTAALEMRERGIEDKWGSYAGSNFRCDVADYIPYGASRACELGVGSSKTERVALLGNSHAQMYGGLLNEVLVSLRLGGLVIPLNTCLPTTSVNTSFECMDLARKNLFTVVNDPSIAHVIIGSTWYADSYLSGAGSEVSFDAITPAINELIDALIAAGKSVALISPIPQPDENLASELPRMVRFGQIDVDEARDRLITPHFYFNERFSSTNLYFTEKLGFGYIRVYDDLCEGDVRMLGRGGGLFFADETHLSDAAIRTFDKTRQQFFTFLAPGNVVESQ